MVSRKQKFSIKDAVQDIREQTTQVIQEEADDFNDFGMETLLQADDAEMVGVEECIEIEVQLSDVDEIILPEIMDTYGRLSDVLESIELVTGLSTLPLNIANISSEVKSLKRHEIFSLGDIRYSMSQEIRLDVVKQYQDKIIKTLKTALPFSESLYTTITYEGRDYKTLALSKAEWSYIMGSFRNYKERLFFTNKNDLVLEILAERVFLH